MGGGGVGCVCLRACVRAYVRACVRVCLCVSVCLYVLRAVCVFTECSVDAKTYERRSRTGVHTLRALASGAFRLATAH